MAKSPESKDAEFRAYLKAFGTLRSRSGFQYILLANCTVIPADASFERAVFQYLHENTHAQLNNTLLGLSLMTVHKMASIVQKGLHEGIAACLEPLQDSPDRESQAIRRNLLVYGRLIDPVQDEAALCRSLSGEVARSLQELADNEAFGVQRYVFESLQRRRQAIWKSWQLIHEGFATFHAVELAEGQDTYHREEVTKAVHTVAEVLKVSVPHRRLDLAPLAAAERRRLVAVKSSIYSRGFSAFSRYGGSERGLYTAWAAALLASYLPYHHTDLLDMTDDAFSAELENGIFDFAGRLERSREAAEQLDPSIDDQAKRDDALRRAFPKAFAEPRCPTWSLFGAWEREALWDSRLMQMYLGKKASDLFQEDGWAAIRTAERDHRTHWRQFEWNHPTLIGPDDRLHEKDGLSPHFRDNFVSFYQVMRTDELFRTLRPWMSPKTHRPH